MFPKSWSLMEIDTHFQSLISISFRVPSKGALPTGSPHSSLGERCPVSRAVALNLSMPKSKSSTTTVSR